MSYQTTNPSTGEALKNYAYLSTQEIESRLGQAHTSFTKWKSVQPAKRAEALRRLAKNLREQKKPLAELMHNEMGKSVAEGIAEIEKCAVTCEYFADKGEEFLKTQKIEAHYKESQVQFAPLGVIFSIMPWNFPFWQFIRFAAPSLMVGNTILLKHSDITAGCGEKIEEICKNIADEQLVFNMHVDHAQAAKIMQEPRVHGVTFTGSTRGGREIAKVAGEALKKTVLELGGSDAYIVLEDADLDLAAKTCVKARMVNNGQSCIAGKRFIVLEKVFDSFVQKMKAEMETFPAAPLAHKKFQTQLQEQVETMKSIGGKVLMGGSIPSQVGAFYPPTMIVFEKNAAEAHQEELFGPVAMVFKAKSLEEAFDMANSSPYGLGGGLFTRDVEKGQALLAEKMEAGTVIVNDYVKSDARLPFGGVKDSGHGRELSVFGLREFCNIKTVARGG